MWFEGTCLPNDFPALLAGFMVTVEPATGTPLWTMVSSNIGTLASDDGWVFHSRGSSGVDNVILGFKNAIHTGSWFEGHRFFVAESYTPAAAGVNGVFGAKLLEAHRYAFDGTHTLTTNTIRYYVSVTRDRVVICTRSYGTSATIVRTMSYLGLIRRYHPEPSSSAVIIASTNPIASNFNNNIRVLRNASGVLGASYFVMYGNASRLARGHGGNVFAFSVPVGSPLEGARGELDGVLVSRYLVGAGAPIDIAYDEAHAVINGVPYLCFAKRSLTGIMNDNFAPAAESILYLIEKK